MARPIWMEDCSESWKPAALAWVAKAPATIIAAAAILKVGFFNGKLLSIESLSEASRRRAPSKKK